MSMRACVGGPMQWQNVITGATASLMAAGHQKDNDGGGGARWSIEYHLSLHWLLFYLYISVHSWLVMVHI